jgi:hypothetical protein
MNVAGAGKATRWGSIGGDVSVGLEDIVAGEGLFWPVLPIRIGKSEG